MKRIVIIGGGLAGLVTAHQLVRNDISCIVVEKKVYPFHRVCGEYVSNEVVPFLQSEKLFPEEFRPPSINRFQLSTVKGRATSLPLDLGGFGISRYNLDQSLFIKAKSCGAEFRLNTVVSDVVFDNNRFYVKAGHEEIEADLVIGSFGKRSALDVKMGRAFVTKRSPYVAVKYHVKTEFPNDLIALHNFEGGYCGVSNVENGITNICYMVHRERLRQYNGIQEFEQDILFRNTLLKCILSNCDHIFKNPITIGEISFQTKQPVENHILMVGDAAGMITPLCGNGMAMAIHSAKVLSEAILQFYKTPNFNRKDLEDYYSREWRRLFASRLWFGRQVQRLFGSHTASNIAVNLAIHVKPLAKLLVKKSHGNPF